MKILAFIVLVVCFLMATTVGYAIGVSKHNSGYQERNDNKKK